jgi:hypothetical protein
VGKALSPEQATGGPRTDAEGKQSVHTGL